MADAPRSSAAPATVKLDDAAFGAEFNGPLVHESVRAELNARRQGTHVDQDPRQGPRRRRQAVAPEGHGPRPRRLVALADLDRRRHRLRPLAAPLHVQGQPQGAPRRAAQRAVACTPSAASLARRRPAAVLDDALDQAGRRSCSPSWGVGGSVARRPRPTTRSAPRCRSATSTRVSRAARRRRRRRRPRSAPPRCSSPRRRSTSSPRAPRRPRAAERGGGLAMDASQVIIRPSSARRATCSPPPTSTRSASIPTRTRRRSARRSRQLFDVKVVEVRTLSVKSKPKRRGLTSGRTRAWKKAIVQVRAGRHDPDLPGPPGPRGGLAACRFASPSPRSPGLPLRLVPGLRGDHEDRAGEDARRGPEEVRRPQRPRPQDLAPSRRRRQAPVPQDRLQAPQGRHPRQGRGDRVRPQPLRLHRAAALRRRREALHPRPGAPAGRRDGAVGPERARSSVGNCLPLANMPIGTVVHNVELQPGRGGQMARSRRHRRSS